MASGASPEDKAKLKAAEIAWLTSSKNWNDDYLKTTSTPNTHWVGKKILGRGNYAVTGLWELVDNVTGEVSKQMAVKQGSLLQPSLNNESLVLKDFQGKGVHIIQLLRERYTDKGQNTFKGLPEYDEIDPLPKEDEDTVERLYLEFCPLGDLEAWMESSIFEEFGSMFNLMPEWIFWKVWECLARGICVLAYGNENLDVEVSDFKDAYVHFDIKPENILLGVSDLNHAKIPIMKIGDFGLCFDIESPQTEGRRRALQHRGDAGVMPPEQHNPERGDQIGSWGNVWQSAKCASMLFTRGKNFFTRMVGPPWTFQFSHPDINNNEAFETWGPDIKKAIEVEDLNANTKGRNYSENVDKMLYWCLAVDPKIRPEPRQLLREILKILKGLGESGETELLESPQTPPPKPSPSQHSSSSGKSPEKQKEDNAGKENKEKGQLPRPSPPHRRFKQRRLIKGKKIQSIQNIRRR